MTVTDEARQAAITAADEMDECDHERAHRAQSGAWLPCWPCRITAALAAGGGAPAVDETALTEAPPRPYVSEAAPEFIEYLNQMREEYDSASRDPDFSRGAKWGISRVLDAAASFRCTVPIGASGGVSTLDLDEIAVSVSNAAIRLSDRDYRVVTTQVNALADEVRRLSGATEPAPAAETLGEIRAAWGRYTQDLDARVHGAVATCRFMEAVQAALGHAPAPSGVREAADEPDAAVELSGCRLCGSGETFRDGAGHDRCRGCETRRVADGEVAEDARCDQCGHPGINHGYGAGCFRCPCMVVRSHLVPAEPGNGGEKP